MRGKRSKTTSLRLTDAEREVLEREASDHDVPLSQLLRARLVSGRAVSAEPARVPPAVRAAGVLPGQRRLALEVHHVDDLGDDHLRANNGAMRK